QCAIDRSCRKTTNGNGIKLLHAVERTRDRFVLDGGDCAERYQLFVWPGYINVLDLLRVQSIHAFDLRDYFVTQAFHVKSVHKISADAGGKVRADLLHIEAHARDLVMIENDL